MYITLIRRSSFNFLLTWFVITVLHNLVLFVISVHNNVGLNHEGTFSPATPIICDCKILREWRHLTDKRALLYVRLTMDKGKPETDRKILHTM